MEELPSFMPWWWRRPSGNTKLAAGHPSLGVLEPGGHTWGCGVSPRCEPDLGNKEVKVRKGREERAASRTSGRLVDARRRETC